MSSMIEQVQRIEYKLNALDNLMGLYFDWKKDTDKFHKHVQAHYKNKEDKNKTGDKQE